MSAPITVYRCFGCDFSTRVRHQSIALHYLMPNAESFVTHRSLGWCSECHDMRDVEPNFDLRKLQQRLEALNQEIREATRPRGIFRFLAQKRPIPDYLEKSQRQLEGMLRISQARTVGSKCLTCGTASVTHLEQQDEEATSNIVHSCGSNLYRVPNEPDAPRFSFRPKVMVLSCSGNIINQEK
jgi:hypothetical protein